MSTARHRIARQTGSFAYFAAVEVNDAPAGSPVVTADLRDARVPRAWVEAATEGASWALALAGTPSCVCITTILGLLTDTSPALVAAAAAQATWKLVDFTPTDLLAGKMERAVEVVGRTFSMVSPSEFLNSIASR